VGRGQLSRGQALEVMVMVMAVALGTSRSACQPLTARNCSAAAAATCSPWPGSGGWRSSACISVTAAAAAAVRSGRAPAGVLRRRCGLEAALTVSCPVGTQTVMSVRSGPSALIASASGISRTTSCAPAAVLLVS
jgi:hypothetical protein